MKPLVCVAPDGSLEVWDVKGVFDLVISGDDFLYKIVILDLRKNQRAFAPQFWGREILGEL